MFAANRVSMSYRTRYGSFRSVDDVSLEVRKGEAVAVIGPSGCGKSSLLLACARLVPLDSGSVTFRGKALLRPSKDYSVLFQNNSLFPWMTVSDNVELPLRIRHVPAPERVATVAHWLNVVGMSEARNLFTRELSGGMRQRTALARAMVSKPEASVHGRRVVGGRCDRSLIATRRTEGLGRGGRTRHSLCYSRSRRGGSTC